MAPALLIRHARILTLDDDFDILDGDLLIEDGRIAAVGPGLPAPAGAVAIDAAGDYLLPGFVQTHVHLCQTLLRKAKGAGRIVALEIMVPTPAIRNLIREDKVHQIYSQMQVGQDKHGMQTLNQSLYSLYRRSLITLEEALGRSSDQDELKMMIEGRTAIPAAQLR